MGGFEALWQSMGIANMEWGQVIMSLVGCGLIYLAVVKNFEPLLLLPIGFGAILTNIPVAGIGGPEGLLGYVYSVGIETGIFPLLIFMGVGALTDFSALIANPKTLFLGAAAQFGIFATVLGAVWLTCTDKTAARFQRKYGLPDYIKQGLHMALGWPAIASIKSARMPLSEMMIEGPLQKESDK